jgi:uncharacterized membrane protein YeaQ/YmgE (transglycosylase-associated protein family)
MTLPALLFGLIVALLIGALYHSVRGGGGGRLLAFLIISVVGFALGQTPAFFFEFVLYKFGWLDIGLGIFGSILLLVLSDWLSHPR